MRLRQPLLQLSIWVWVVAITTGPALGQHQASRQTSAAPVALGQTSAAPVALGQTSAAPVALGQTSAAPAALAPASAVPVALSQTSAAPAPATAAHGLEHDVGASSAGAPDPAAVAPRRIDLAAAIRLAESHAPELLGPRAELASVGALQAAANRPFHRPARLELSAGPRHVPGAGRLGVDTTVGLFQEFSTSGYGTELDRYAKASKLRAEASLAAARRDAGVSASLAWLDALEARALLSIRKRAVEGAREILRIAEARVAAGRSSPGESALARSLVGNAEAAVLGAEGAITTADASLRHLCGIPLHRQLEIEGDLELPKAHIDEEALRHHVRDVSPELLATRAHAASLEQAAQLGRAGTRPFIEVGPSVTREGTGEWAFVAHLRMALPGIDPAAADNAERQLTARVARASVQSTEQAILRDVEVALHEREHALRVRDLLRTSSIAPAELAARQAELQYEAGRADLVSVITAKRELFGALEHWTVAAVDVRRAEATLQRYVAYQLQQKGRLPEGAR